ncbi:NtaA/DmoA family FMN-dependent monooxygenase [Nocardia speluncae]|uniref:NtaA/DmoA family FMN-dependent monooxygenase n=1 Tax=Nocardia speluncae TaxID=419477 RepID=A0A846XI39_9NOCA|nr:NtaA/DmoA family FMN-dependent monooxygenase [Nocardia speluncae]NKY33514.1 NtaA/DmoA family FMN-dependent monooxygenase [Nocardia speluncae]
MNQPVAHLGVIFPGNNESVVWRHPATRSFLELDTYLDFARTAERGGLDFLFLAERLGIRGAAGRVHEHLAAGRVDNLTVLAALARATTHLGLVATLNTTFNDALTLARQLATLDQLSAGRAAWNIVTTETVGSNFSAGNYLAHDERYTRAGEVVDLVRQLWRAAPEAAVRHEGRFQSYAGSPGLGRSRQGEPVLVQAGASADGRAFAARYADVVFTNAGGDIERARAFRADLRRLAGQAGRDPARVLVLPEFGFVVGDTAAEAVEQAAYLTDLKVSPLFARAWLEDMWRRPYPDFDIDGPLPAEEPDYAGGLPADDRFAVRAATTHQQRVTAYRDLAEQQGFTVRQLIAHLKRDSLFAGTPEAIADEIERWVTTGASDGFILSPPVIVDSLTRFVDSVVPRLRARGLLRETYAGSTLRDHLGLPGPTAGTPAD